MGSEYTPNEIMAVTAARALANGDVVFVGIGLPNLACNLARATHAPDLVLIYESGAVGAVPERLPVSIGDPALVTGCLMVASMADVFQYMLQNGRIGNPTFLTLWRYARALDDQPTVIFLEACRSAADAIASGGAPPRGE